MDQKKLGRKKVNLRLFLLMAAAWLTLLGLILMGYSLQWTGFRERTLWDWMQLFLTATVTSIIAYLGQNISRQQYLGQQEAEENRAQAEALEAYLDQLGQLLLDDKRPLRKSVEGDEERTLARAWTLAVLSRLSGARKGTVVQFLYEANLITRDYVVVEPMGADLAKANLTEANLKGASLRGAYLARAKLDDAKLSKADLRDTKLFGAYLRNANLSDANLKGASGTVEEQLEQAQSLKGATMPNGQKYEDWLKSKDSKEDG